MKKRWVNPNAPEEEEKKLAPPPKASSSTTAASSVPPSTTPVSSVPPSTTPISSAPASTNSTVPALAVNNNSLLNKSGKSDLESLLNAGNSKFGISNRRSTGNIKRGARNRYVDVMANSSTPTKNIGSSFLPPPSFN